MHLDAIRKSVSVRVTTLHSVSRLLLLAALVLLPFAPCAAQARGSSLNGIVTDSSGQPLADVRVQVVADATGLRRETLTSSAGIFEISDLPVGSYSVQFVHVGFQEVRYANVTQRLEQTRTLNVALHVAAQFEHVEVVADAQSLDETSDTLGANVERKQISELPINGQNWSTLTALVPAGIDTAGSSGGGNQRSVRFAGRGRDDNNFTYDGIDATNIINQGQQPYVRLAIPIDTIQDLRVDPMLATAQSGVTGGGQLAVVSSSGTNKLHGGVYDFLRNDLFDATAPIDVLNPRHKPAFHLNQFGGSLGGPIVRDRTFFYLAYEGYRQSLGQTLIGYVPSKAFRDYVEALSPALAPVLNAYPTGGTSVTPSKSNACPAAVPDCVHQWVGNGQQVGQEDSGMVRLDHRFSNETLVFARANIDEASSANPYSPSASQYLDEQVQLTSFPANVAVALTHAFSPTFLNIASFGFNRSTANTRYVNPEGQLYAVAVTGFTTLNNGRATRNTGNTFAGIDNLTLSKGRHVIKAGAEVREVQLNQGSGSYGTLSYKSFAAFSTNTAYKASITGLLPVNELRKTQFYGYLQDEFKWRPDFTVNLGLRYSFFNVFHNAQGRGNPFDFATCGPQGYCGVGASYGQPNYGDIDPRVAIAWAPRMFDGKTVIRSGFGLYHEDGQLDDQNIPNKNEIVTYTLGSVSYPIVLDENGAPVGVPASGSITPNAQARQRKDTYVAQWGLSIQQALPQSVTGTISYVGSKGTHLLSLSYLNVQDPATRLRPYPQYNQIPWRGTGGNSEYDALSLSLRRYFTQGLLFSANYTWSHEIDDGSNGSGDGDSLAPQNVSCLPTGSPRCGERASGAFDARHVFNGNLVWELPFGATKPYLTQPGVLRAVFGSWSLSSIVTARTGFPVNITVTRVAPDGNSNNQRPDLVNGLPLHLSNGNINPAAFAVPTAIAFGNVPRDFLRGPGAWQTDLALAKHISLGERAELQFRTEVFNIFNHALYGLPDGNISDSNFGKLLSPLNPTPIGMGTPRQFQFMLKAQF